MKTQKPATWFERTFRFENLEGTFPNILERLKHTPLRFEWKVSNIPQERWKLKIDDKWSIQEQVGHMADLEPLWISRVNDYIFNKEVLTPADLTNTKTHEADHNNESMDTLLFFFKQHRHSLVAQLISLADEAEKLTSLHPRLNTPMRPIDLMYFVAEHDDHHLAMIEYINARIPRELNPDITRL